MTDKLLSRKFWLAVTACLFFAFNGAMEQIATVTVAYLAVQAGVDAFETYTASRTTEPTPVSPAAPEAGDDEEVSGWTGSVI